MGTRPRLLRFRCTGCGNCCKEPLLPLTAQDLRRLVQRSGKAARAIARFASPDEIDLDDPEAFATLRGGPRVMVLAHRKRGCMFLDARDRCGVYEYRPLGCRVFPLDASFGHNDQLRRLELIDVVRCDYELDGQQSARKLRSLNQRYERELDAYHRRLARWNERQAKRKRQGLAAETSSALLSYLGF